MEKYIANYTDRQNKCWAIVFYSYSLEDAKKTACENRGDSTLYSVRKFDYNW